MSNLFGDIQFYMVLGQLFLIGVIYKTHKDNMKRLYINEKEKNIKYLESCIRNVVKTQLSKENYKSVFGELINYQHLMNKNVKTKIDKMSYELSNEEESKTMETMLNIGEDLYVDKLDIVKEREKMSYSFIHNWIKSLRSKIKKE